MRIRRLAIAGVAVAAIAGLTGCGPKSDSTAASTAGATTGSSSPAAAATSSAPADAESELGDAAAKLADTSVKLNLTAVGGITISGAVDATSQKAEMKTDMGSAGSMLIRQVGNDLYVKTGGQLGTAIGAAEGKWMHIDMTKVPEKSALNVKNNDPRSTAKMLASSTDVTKTGDHTFAGKIDLTKSPTMNPAALKALGSKAEAVPFTAETDAEGRLSELSIDLNSIASGAGKMVASYSDFGTPVNVAAPAKSQVVEMPAKFRKAMGA